MAQKTDKRQELRKAKYKARLLSKRDGPPTKRRKNRTRSQYLNQKSLGNTIPGSRLVRVGKRIEREEDSK